MSNIKFKAFPKIARRLAIVCTDFGVSFEPHKGRVCALCPIDSRTPFWSAVKECIDANGAKCPLGVRVRARLLSPPGVGCAECLKDMYNFIYKKLVLQFGVPQEPGRDDFWVEFGPTAEVISFIEDTLRNPELDKIFVSTCPSGHRRVSGDYVMTVMLVIQDTLFEVDFYME